VHPAAPVLHKPFAPQDLVVAVETLASTGRMPGSYGRGIDARRMIGSMATRPRTASGTGSSG